MTSSNRSMARLLRPGSVAIVGASNRSGSFSYNLLNSLRSNGYQGQLLPINPRYTEIDGIPCYPSFADLPVTPDCALYAVGDRNLIPMVELAAQAGVGGGVIFGRVQGHDDQGRDIQSSISEIGRRADMAICGGNCMGYLNLRDGLQVAGMPFAGLTASSGISLISHSGSSWAALVGNRRGLGFDFAISAGQELVTNLGHYIDFLLDQPGTRAIVCIIEAVRDPERFLAAVNRADRMGVPIIALKLGRSERGKQFAVSHSGAMSGSAAVYDAVFAAQNIIQVRTLDELLDTVELFAATPRPQIPGVAIGTDSGGERQLIVDLASEIGVSLPALSEATGAKIEALLDPGMAAANPLDYWGDGGDVMAPCLSLLAADPAVGMVVMASNMPPGRPFVAQCAQAIIDVRQQTDKPLALMGNSATTMASEGIAQVRAAGIPVLMGTDSALKAVRHFTTYRAGTAMAPAKTEAADIARVSAWRARVTPTAEGNLSSADGFDLLAEFGIATARFARIRGVEGLARFTGTGGFPMVLKLDDPAIPHKSEVGGVILGIGSPEKAHESHALLHSRHPGAALIAQAQASGFELILGMTTDADFGPMVTVGLGGIYAEIFRESVVLPPPIGRNAAETALRSLKFFPVLEGARGKAAADLDALLRTVEAFGRLAAAATGIISEIEINPLLIGPDGAVAVDCLTTLSGYASHAQ